MVSWQVFGMLFAISITSLHPLHPSLPFSQNPEVLPHDDGEMKSRPRRHPEEEKGLNIIICVVIVSMQLVEVSAEGSCWLFPMFSRVLFFQGLDELRC